MGKKEPEALCVDVVVTIALRLLPENLESPLGKSGELEVLFDQNEEFLHKLNRVWRRRRRQGVFSLIGDVRDADMRKAPGLQAADFAAWHWNRHLRDGCSVAEMRAVFSAPGYRKYFDYEALRQKYYSSV
ncbi:MAG: hypothetical protein R2724_02945 [Bryobacterales bacterium]